MISLLVLLAILVGIAGVVQLFSGDVLLGVVLIIVACAIGPGGWSIWH